MKKCINSNLELQWQIDWDNWELISLYHGRNGKLIVSIVWSIA